MSTGIPPALALSDLQGRPAISRVRSAARTENRKLMARLPLRLVAVLCLLGPFAFAVLLRVQSGTPSDALFGVWVHTSGFAVSLVVLGFAANWGFPIVAGALAGDLFASEDRLGTWPTILTRSRSLEEVFAGKVLAAATFRAIGSGVLLAVSSLAAGLSLVGAQPMVDLAGRELPGRSSPGADQPELADLTAPRAGLHQPGNPVLRGLAQRDRRRARSGPGGPPHPTAGPAWPGRWVRMLLIGSASTPGTGYSWTTRSSVPCWCR